MICLSVLAMSSTMFAQKQESGSQTIEMEFAPLGSEPLKINSFRYRYFTSDNIALRASLFVGGKGTTTYGELEEGATQTKSKNSNLDFTFRPGIEKHFDGTDKLSPYVGGELYLGLETTKDKAESNWSSDPKKIQTETTKTSKSTFGLNALMGVDYYVTDHLYLGAELGFGFLNSGKGKTKITYDNPESEGTSDSETTGNSSSLDWGPNYQGTIRLGWVFK